MVDIREQFYLEKTKSVFIAPEKEQPLRALELTSEIVQKCLLGEIPRDEACYYIAGFMFLPIANTDPDFDDMCGIAGELELPEHLLSSSADDDWQLLISLLDKLTQKYSPSLT